MRRPLCLICLLFVLVIMVFMPLFMPYLHTEPLPENHTQSDFIGRIYEIESANGKSVLYLENRERQLSVLCYMSEDIPDLKIGNTVRVRGKVRLFEQASNDGQFDAQMYYGILHIDYAISVNDWELTDASYHPVCQCLHDIKMQLGKSLDAGLSEDDAGVLKAMLLGDKKSMTQSVKGLYRRNGIAHIIAVSGLHITLWGMGLCRLLKRFYIPLPIANFLSFLFVVLYGMMTGSQASAVRSILMFSLSLLAPVVRRTYDMMTATSLSAAVLLFINPLYVYHSGFLLSFAAVAGIALLLPCLSDIYTKDDLIRRMIIEAPSRKSRIKKKVKRFFSSSLSVSLSVTLATLPIQLYFFYTVPVYSVILNLFITPLVGSLMMLGMGGAVLGCLLFQIPEIGKALLYPCHLILAFYERLCRLFDLFPAAHPVIAKPTIWRIVLYYAVLAGILFFAGRLVKKRRPSYITYSDRTGDHDGKNNNRQRHTPAGTRAITGMTGIGKIQITAAGLLILNMILICVSPRFCTKITMLDVGQGDCFVIEEAGGKTVLVDGGSSSVSEVGKYRIAPFLKSHGIARLDYVFLSHADADHTNGVLEILQNGDSDGITISCLVLTKCADESEKYHDIEAACKNKGVKVAYIAEGDYLKCGNLCFSCLYPGKINKDYAADNDKKNTEYVSAQDENDNSMVLLMEYKDFKMLFTGDFSSKTEPYLSLTDADGNEIKHIDILKTAHHGSRFSTSEEFLEDLSPTAALISAGKENSYGHPHKETLKRLNEAGAQIFRTDESGQITVRIKKKAFKVQKYLK